ncbi:MAG: 1-deoxy-D-xylulose-5-phosphate reductoisomerase [Campylobacterales bacterium]|nr:1-deoxy-D-xylulose-5-phosphate reductoisomerase [Campylobacterales bacterium]
MIVLGSTGSIGVNTLYIAKKFGLKVETLVAGRNTELLQQQINEFQPERVVVGDLESKEKISHPNVTYGEEAILEAIEVSKSDVVVNALVGFLGLKPTLKAQELGKKIALANKESLVAGGKFIDCSNITPIDSEHFGLWYLLQDKKQISKMYITASGGAFRDWNVKDIAKASLADTQKHPNWSMGQKITIDSATMVNKIFELLEGYWLFKDKFHTAPALDGFIETKSIIHALIDFVDGSTTAHIANADMKLPIAYALMRKVDTEILKPVDFTELGSMEFRKIGTDRYPAWKIKDELLANPDLGVVVNSANEVAIDSFIKGKCDFSDISRNILVTVEKYKGITLNCVDDVFQIDREIRDRGIYPFK